MRTSIVKALSVATLGLFVATGAFAADQLNANNKVTQSNSGARAKQTVEIGVYK